MYMMYEYQPLAIADYVLINYNVRAWVPIAATSSTLQFNLVEFCEVARVIYEGTQAMCFNHLIITIQGKDEI